MDITTLEMLREHYAEPKERAVRKEIRALDVHCRRFIGLSPFLILATSDKNHNMDASPRGGAPGFVKVTADGAVLIPDAPGNNRLDSFANILATRKVGLLFLIHTLGLMQGMGKPVDVSRGVAAGVGVLLVILGNFMGKVTRNFFVGIRTPWTLASEEVWLRTHRFGGRLFVLAGLVLFVLAVLGGGWVVAVIAIGSATVLSVVYSYLVYRRVEGFKESASRSAP